MNYHPPAPGLQKAHPGQDFALIAALSAEAAGLP
jgi:hypothetical protein